MNTQPTIKILQRHHLIEASATLLVTYADAIGLGGVSVEGWPDFIKAARYGSLPLSFAKPTHCRPVGGLYVDYTCGSMTLRVHLA